MQSLHAGPRPSPVECGGFLSFAEALGHQCLLPWSMGAVPTGDLGQVASYCMVVLRVVPFEDGSCKSGTMAIDLFLCRVWFSFQVDNLLLVVMESAHLIIQRKAFQQSIEGLMTLRHEQTSSQPVIAKALQQLKVLTMLASGYNAVEMSHGVR